MERITIVRDRYNGSYSGAAYTAWRGEPPDEIAGGDDECLNFWDGESVPPHGKGSTPEEALRALLALLSLEQRGVV